MQNNKSVPSIISNDQRDRLIRYLNVADQHRRVSDPSSWRNNSEPTNELIGKKNLAILAAMAALDAAKKVNVPKEARNSAPHFGDTSDDFPATWETQSLEHINNLNEECSTDGEIISSYASAFLKSNLPAKKVNNSITSYASLSPNQEKEDNAVISSDTPCFRSFSQSSPDSFSQSEALQKDQRIKNFSPQTKIHNSQFGKMNDGHQVYSEISSKDDNNEYIVKYSSSQSSSNPIMCSPSSSSFNVRDRVVAEACIPATISVPSTTAHARQNKSLSSNTEQIIEEELNASVVTLGGHLDNPNFLKNNKKFDLKKNQSSNKVKSVSRDGLGGTSSNARAITLSSSLIGRNENDDDNGLDRNYNFESDDVDAKSCSTCISVRSISGVAKDSGYPEGNENTTEVCVTVSNNKLKKNSSKKINYNMQLTKFDNDDDNNDGEDNYVLSPSVSHDRLRHEMRKLQVCEVKNFSPLVSSSAPPSPEMPFAVLKHNTKKKIVEDTNKIKNFNNSFNNDVHFNNSHSLHSRKPKKYTNDGFNDDDYDSRPSYMFQRSTISESNDYNNHHRGIISEQSEIDEDDEDKLLMSLSQLSTKRKQQLKLNSERDLDPGVALSSVIASLNQKNDVNNERSNKTHEINLNRPSTTDVLQQASHYFPPNTQSASNVSSSYLQKNKLKKIISQNIQAKDDKTAGILSRKLLGHTPDKESPARRPKHTAQIGHQNIDADDDVPRVTSPMPFLSSANVSSRSQTQPANSLSTNHIPCSAYTAAAVRTLARPVSPSPQRPAFSPARVDTPPYQRRLHSSSPDQQKKQGTAANSPLRTTSLKRPSSSRERTSSVKAPGSSTVLKEAKRFSSSASSSLPIQSVVAQQAANVKYDHVSNPIVRKLCEDFALTSDVVRGRASYPESTSHLSVHRRNVFSDDNTRKQTNSDIERKFGTYATVLSTPIEKVNDANNNNADMKLQPSIIEVETYGNNRSSIDIGCHFPHSYSSRNYGVNVVVERKVNSPSKNQTPPQNNLTVNQDIAKKDVNENYLTSSSTIPASSFATATTTTNASAVANPSIQQLLDKIDSLTLQNQKLQSHINFMEESQIRESETACKTRAALEAQVVSMRESNAKSNLEVTRLQSCMRIRDSENHAHKEENSKLRQQIILLDRTSDACSNRLGGLNQRLHSIEEQKSLMHEEINRLKDFLTRERRAVDALDAENAILRRLHDKASKDLAELKGEGIISTSSGDLIALARGGHISDRRRRELHADGETKKKNNQVVLEEKIDLDLHVDSSGILRQVTAKISSPGRNRRDNQVHSDQKRDRMDEIDEGVELERLHRRDKQKNNKNNNFQSFSPVSLNATLNRDKNGFSQHPQQNKQPEKDISTLSSDVSSLSRFDQIAQKALHNFRKENPVLQQNQMYQNGYCSSSSSSIPSSPITTHKPDRKRNSHEHLNNDSHINQNEMNNGKSNVEPHQPPPPPPPYTIVSSPPTSSTQMLKRNDYSSSPNRNNAVCSLAPLKTTTMTGNSDSTTNVIRTTLKPSPPGRPPSSSIPASVLDRYDASSRAFSYLTERTRRILKDSETFHNCGLRTPPIHTSSSSSLLPNSAHQQFSPVSQYKIRPQNYVEKEHFQPLPKELLDGLHDAVVQLHTSNKMKTAGGLTIENEPSVLREILCKLDLDNENEPISTVGSEAGNDACMISSESKKMSNFDSYLDNLSKKLSCRSSLKSDQYIHSAKHKNFTQDVSSTTSALQSYNCFESNPQADGRAD